MLTFKLKSIIIAILALLPLALSANGGGVYAISATMRSSDPRFREIRDITLLSEKLYIRLNSDRADITVKYTLVNNSDKDYIGTDYAFPIDYVTLNPSDFSDVWSTSSLKKLNFILDGNSLPYKYSEEKIQEDAPVIANVYGEGYTKNYARRWFYTQLDIKKNSIVNLEVNYSVQTLALADGDDPTNTWYITAAFLHKFRYDFSPAKYWGDGVVRDFYVQIDVSDLALNGNLNTKNNDYDDYLTDNLKIDGLSFEKVNNLYEYRQRNFDLKKSDPINITYLTPEFSSTDILSDHLIVPNEYTVKASSEKSRYPVSNLTDLNLETAWVPTKSVGEWIEFTFKEPHRYIPGGVIILNGYLKNENTYYENNRIKKILLEAKPLGKEWIKINASYSDDSLTILRDRKYQSIYFENLFSPDFYDRIDFYDTEIDSETAIEKIKITILDVYSGSKYDDTCISEILFLQ